MQIASSRAVGNLAIYRTGMRTRRCTVWSVYRMTRFVRHGRCDWLDAPVVPYFDISVNNVTYFNY